MRFMKRAGTAALGVTAVLAMVAPVARAAPLTWDWTWSGADTGGGTMTTDPEASGHYLITAMTGTWDGSTITGLIPPEPTILGNDNILFAEFPQLNVFGLAFAVESDEIILYYNGAFGGYNILDSNTLSNRLGTFEATLAASAIPEPTSLALFGAALIGLGVIRRRRSPAAPGA